jgi:hypothetical protein
VNSAKVLFAGVILLLAAGTSGCDSQSNDGEDAPEVLSSDVFSLETDLFGESAAKDPQQKANFVAAALRVWPVSIVVGANLIVPAAVTAAALEDTPEFVDGAWEWASTASVEGSDVGFNLYARPDGSYLDWSMVITGIDPETGDVYDSFELYSARTMFGEQTGGWDLYYRIDGARTNVLSADFDVNDSDGMTSVTYTVPSTAAEHAGDSVTYEVSGDSRRFVWHQIAESIDHEVTWNAVTHEGSILATNYNGGVMACWDATLEDAACGQ